MGQRIKLFERRRSKNLSNRCGVYAIYVDTHTYVGSSEDLSRRMTEHRLDIPKEKRGCRLLHELYKCHSKNDFYYEILEYCSPERRLSREEYYIHQLNADCNTAKDLQHPVTNYRKVYQYDNNGNYLCEHLSVASAARKVGGQGGNISNAANYYRYAYNSLWSFIKSDHYPHTTKTKIKTKSVCMFRSGSREFIKEFQSIADAARYLAKAYSLNIGFDSLCSSIGRYCKHPSTCFMGLMFCFAEDYKSSSSYK